MQDTPSVRFTSLEPESQLCSALVMSTKMAIQATFSHLVSKRSIKNYKCVTLEIYSLILLLYMSTLLHLEKFTPHS